MVVYNANNEFITKMAASHSLRRQTILDIQDEAGSTTHPNPKRGQHQTKANAQRKEEDHPIKNKKAKPALPSVSTETQSHGHNHDGARSGRVLRDQDHNTQVILCQALGVPSLNYNMVHEILYRVSEIGPR